MEKEESEKNPEKEINAIKSKWSTILTKPGWVTLPSTILEAQADLKLEPVDINIILHLANYWWTKEKKPYPSKSTIAKRMNRSPNAIQKRIARLEKMGLVQRIKRFDKDSNGQLSNMYELGGLIEKAKPYAKEIMKLRKKQMGERKNLIKERR
jgi:predicted transcriptional regulator